MTHMEHGVKVSGTCLTIHARFRHMKAALLCNDAIVVGRLAFDFNFQSSIRVSIEILKYGEAYMHVRDYI
jgi:hypothetical protein